MGVFLGKRLKELRELRGLSVSQVAQKLKVSPSTYRDWEYGREIKGEPYPSICTLFGVSYHFLFTGEQVGAEEILTEVEVKLQKIRERL